MMRLYQCDADSDRSLSMTDGVIEVSSPSLKYYVVIGGAYVQIPKPAYKRQERYTVTSDASGLVTISPSPAFSAAPNINTGPLPNNKEVITMSGTPTGSSVVLKVEVRTDALGLLPSYSAVNGRTFDVILTEK